MSRLRLATFLAKHLAQQSMFTARTLSYGFSTVVQTQMPTNQSNWSTSGPGCGQAMNQYSRNDAETMQKLYRGENVSRKDKINFLISNLLDLKEDSKDAIYGALDAWVAWEQSFPIGPLKRVLLTLEKEQQWHRVIQVIKWMLSKGQGNTMGTYGQLIRALDIDHRAEEAHEFWVKKIGSDLHSVPWKVCNIMISVYYRNNMLENLVRLFKGLESFDRKPVEKSVVQKVANAYEILGRLEEKERVLEKWSHLFTETSGPTQKSSKVHSKINRKSRQRKPSLESSETDTNLLAPSHAMIASGDN